MKLVREKVFGLKQSDKNISVVISCEYFCKLTIQSCAGKTVSFSWKLIGNKMYKCSCIIHYDFITTSDQLIKVSQASYKVLTESKEIREWLGQENHHEEQCNGIPEALGENSRFYHRECYQKFTFAKTILKRKRDQVDDPIKCRKRLSREHGVSDSKNSRGLFPKHCMIFLKERIKVKGKFQLPTKIINMSAEETLKKAAVLKYDLAMLASVTDTDLIVKEFSKHEKCYLEYRRITREKSANTSTISEKSDIQGDFDAVCEVIEKRVLEEQQCLSMESIASKRAFYKGMVMIFCLFPMRNTLLSL